MKAPDVDWSSIPAFLADAASGATRLEWLWQAIAVVVALVLGYLFTRLVYGTCSLLAEENEDIVQQFLAKHPDFQALSARDVLERQGISVPGVDRFLRLYPHVHDTDGFFAAVMQRQGNRT